MKLIERLKLALDKLNETFSEFKPGMGLEEIKAEYKEKVYNSLLDYANSNRTIVSFRNQFRRAVNDAFTFTAYAGWVDGGGDGPIPSGLQTWLNARIDQELKYVDGVFLKLKLLKKKGDENALKEFAQARADGYASSLDGIYNQGKAWANKDKWGTWRYGDTEHCKTCAMLNGKRHKLSWFIKNGYIPREAGSKTLDCHGFRCKCYVVDDDGDLLL